MRPTSQFWRDKRVCITGGTGFLGWHLARLLRPLASHVRIMGLPPRSTVVADELRSFDCVFGDIRNGNAVADAVRGCDIVFHTAGTVGVWGPALVQMHEIHLEGTRQVVGALPSGARLVHTSSVVAVGASRSGEVLTEDSPFQLAQLKVDYVHAKRGAEELALAAAGAGRDVVIVNPAYLLGPDDHEASVMGRLCLRSWKGRVPMIPPGGLNFVDVRDVAIGHLLAAERGESRRRYILGGVNLTMMEFMRELLAIRGMTTRWRFRMPGWLYALIACAAEARAYFVGREPYPSIQHVRTNRYYWYYSWQRAHSELGYEARPLSQTLKDSHDWYCATGQMKPPVSPPHAA